MTARLCSKCRKTVLSVYNRDLDLCFACQRKDRDARDRAVEANEERLRAQGYAWCHRCEKLRKPRPSGRCSYCQAALVGLEVC